MAAARREGGGETGGGETVGRDVRAGEKRPGGVAVAGRGRDGGGDGRAASATMSAAVMWQELRGLCTKHCFVRSFKLCIT